MTVTAIIAALFVGSWLGVGLAALLNAASYEPVPVEDWSEEGLDRLIAEIDNGHNTNGFVWVVMPEEPSSLDPEPYVFTDQIAAERFKQQHGGWVSEEPILDNSFNQEEVA